MKPIAVVPTETCITLPSPLGKPLMVVIFMPRLLATPISVTPLVPRTNILGVGGTLPAVLARLIHKVRVKLETVPKPSAELLTTAAVGPGFGTALPVAPPVKAKFTARPILFTPEPDAPAKLDDAPEALV